MDCKHIQDILLTDYIDGELFGDKKDAIDSHLFACDECRQILAAALLNDKSLQPLPPSFSQDEIWSKIKQRIEEKETVPFNPFLDFMGKVKPFFTVPKVAFVTLALILTVYYFAPRQQIQIADSTKQVNAQYLVYLDEESSTNPLEESYDTDIENYFL
jgi:hypothetical protein